MKEWKSIKDELPKSNEKVILALLDTRYNSQRQYLQIATVGRVSSKPDAIYFFSCSITHEKILDEITHWMPLPDFPKL